MNRAGHSLPPQAIWQQNGSDVILKVTGDWARDGPAAIVTGAVPNRYADHYQTVELGAYDSTLPTFLLDHFRAVADTENGATAALPPLVGLPDDLRGLLELALAVHVPPGSSTRMVVGSPGADSMMLV